MDGFLAFVTNHKIYAVTLRSHNRLWYAEKYTEVVLCVSGLAVSLASTNEICS